MIKVFKWWWAWNFEEVEDWLERMEAGGLRLVETKFNGVYFCFEKCTPTKARYCIDYQNKLTPEYITIINDDGWKLHQIGMGWYCLRKEYQEEERPELYTDFEGLIARNKVLLSIVIIGLAIEFICLGGMIGGLLESPDNGRLAYTCILGALVLALFSFIIANLGMQISKFNKKKN